MGSAFEEIKFHSNEMKLKETVNIGILFTYMLLCSVGIRRESPTPYLVSSKKKENCKVKILGEMFRLCRMPRRGMQEENSNAVAAYQCLGKFTSYAHSINVWGFIMNVAIIK